MVCADGPVGLDGVTVCLDDERTVADACRAERGAC